MRGLIRLSLVLKMSLLVGVLACSWSPAAFAQVPRKVEQRRIARLATHLKRLKRPQDWLLVRKLFSSDSTVQLNALSNCPLPESEWPWYLSSDHLRNYAFSVDFIPLNMDGDERLETLMIIQSDYGNPKTGEAKPGGEPDPGAAQYITFCLMDDKVRGRVPLSSYSDRSHGREITYQIADLTADGAYEVSLNVREGSGDAVRVIKLTGENRLLPAEFGRAGGSPGARIRFRFGGPGSPATLILRGAREDGERAASEEFWRWEEETGRFVRLPARAGEDAKVAGNGRKNMKKKGVKR